MIRKLTIAALAFVFLLWLWATALELGERYGYL